MYKPLELSTNWWGVKTMLLKEFNENDGDLLNIIKDTVNRFIIDEEYLGVCIISCLKKLLFATAGLENIIKLEKLPQIVAQIFKYQENFSACSIESKTYRIYIIPFYLIPFSLITS